ncbi:phage tail tape measure protein [bacterium]|nr:MAG: phage tail tape measure protein [bacterium]RKZ72429.1 MAG: phage tail tape measure protein [Gammaproteobacteria bacterium]
MATEQLVIQVSEKGTLVVKRKLDGLGNSAQKAGGGVKLLRTALGGLATIGIAASLAKSVQLLAKFSQEMSTVAAVTKATANEMEDLTAVARELGATTRFSATQAAEGMTFLARAGFEVDEVMSAIGPTLKLAQAGGLGLGRAADIASNVLTGFGLAATEAARTIDVLALAANSANTNVDQLGEGMSYVAPIARILGVSLEETTAGIQTLSDAGIQASRSGTNLTMVMRLMTASTPKQTKVLQELGLTTKDIDITSKGLAGALMTMNEAGLSTEQTFRFFGRSAAAAGVLLAGTEGKMQSYTKANMEAEGSADRMAKVMDDNLNGALLAVKSAWEELQLSLADLGPQSALTQGLKNLASVLRLAADNVEILTSAIISLGIAFTGIKFAPFLAGINSGTAVMALLTKGVVAARTAMASLALNPVTIGMLALAAAVVAVTAAFDKYKKLQDELEAIEERTYKMRLAHVQAKVREIHQRKAATKAVAGYLDKIEMENKFLGFTTAEQELSIEKTRALELAKRQLTDAESTRLVSLVKERNAIKAANEQRDNENELLASIKQPAAEYNTQLQLLDSLMSQNRVTAAEYDATLAGLQEKYNQLGDTAGADYLAGLAQENELLAMNNAERQEAQALLSARQAIGSDLTTEQADAVKALVAERQALAATGYLEALAQENELLQMNSAEREQQAAYKAAEAAIGVPLTEQQKATVDNLRAENEQIRLQNELLEQINGPQQLYNEQVAALDVLLANADINLQQYSDAVGSLTKTLSDSTADSAQVIEDSWGSVWKSAGSALDEFASGGVITFKGFADSLIQDLQRIIQKQILMLAFKSMGIPIPGFATGGSFTIGGSGGTDSKVAMFKATPGERVDVLTPGQQRNQPQAAAAPVINIVNVTDPNEIPDAMASTEGEQVIVNTITRNRDTIRQAIS